MAYYWKIIGFVMVAVILWLVLDKREKDLAILLNLAVCCALAAAAMAYLQPVLEWIRQLCAIGNLEEEMLRTLLKAVGAGTAAEITGMICLDAGNSSLSGVVRLVGSCAVLYISIPAMQTLMNLIWEILGVL
jgi:stage III sporulation protein AD